jgi:MscS family membrane protein
VGGQLSDGAAAAVTQVARTGLPVLTLFAAFAVNAQEPRDTARRDSTRAEITVEPSAESPRVALQEFLTLTRAARYGDASIYLDAGDVTRAELAILARQLKSVLDRHLWIDLERVSPRAAGDTADGLAMELEHIGTVRMGTEPPAPIRLQRVMPNAEVSWRFSRSTVARIPTLYAALDNRWMLENLPEVLLRPGPFDILRWQWLALALLLALAGLLGSIISRLVRTALWRLVQRTRSEWDDAILTRVAGPLTAALTLALMALMLPWLDLFQPAEQASFRAIRVGLFLVFFWSLWRLVDVTRLVLSHTRWAHNSPSSRALLPLGARISKIMVLAIAAVAVLSLLGLPVASLIAGLGIGGLALALAAQKTVENLFGAFSIGVDQPFREGDFVKIEDFVGTVEAVGLRSSRFRTLDRTVITIPNGKLADMRLESFTARDRMRLATIIGLVYETTAAQMRDVLQGFEHVLRAHPKIWPDAVVVRFREFGASSLDIEIMAWFQTSEWSEFQLIRQEILLQFMDVVERAGSSIAFPTRTIHLGAEAIAAIANHRDESTAGSVVGDGGTSALRASSPHARGTTPNDSHRG